MKITNERFGEIMKELSDAGVMYAIVIVQKDGDGAMLMQDFNPIGEECPAIENRVDIIKDSEGREMRGVRYSIKPDLDREEAAKSLNITMNMLRALLDAMEDMTGTVPELTDKLIAQFKNYYH